MNQVSLLYDDQYLEHVTPSGHPEMPDRLRRIIHILKEQGMWDGLRHIVPSPAAADDLERVHTRRHIEHIKRVCDRGGGVLDAGDTHVSGKSCATAFLAAGAVLTAIDSTLADNGGPAFCAVRPPGHHAERELPMGFCLFNNVAVGARYAQHRHGIERVAIIDWDVHHGNGTQHIFEDDPSVFYISLHQFPFYPGTGGRDERGVGAGEGYTLNFPFPAGTGEERYLEAFHSEIVPALQQFRPGLLLLSAGFDAHREDPLAEMLLTDESYARMTDLVKGIAPVVSVLEGGYNLDALARSVQAHLAALARS